MESIRASLTDDRLKGEVEAHKLFANIMTREDCKNYTGIEALGQPGTNFNVSAGETISLYDKQGNSLHAVGIPDLGSGDSIFELDPKTGIFREIVH